jgi:hypothetical protein
LRSSGKSCLLLVGSDGRVEGGWVELPDPVFFPSTGLLLEAK